VLGAGFMRSVGFRLMLLGTGFVRSIGVRLRVSESCRSAEACCCAVASSVDTHVLQ
jgi:hypothetical protein